MKKQTFSDKVYTLLKTVPKGRVTTYKAIADQLHIKAYRAIGQILRKNPFAPVIPCHRVVANDGTIGGFMGKTDGPEIKKKIALLSSEGIMIKNNRVVDFENTCYQWK
jgi:methylated-DNA-[protein]-cysteine S-methyltransferase